MMPMLAMEVHSAELSMVRFQSLTSRRHRPNQAKVRFTTHRRSKTSNPFAVSDGNIQDRIHHLTHVRLARSTARFAGGMSGARIAHSSSTKSLECLKWSGLYCLRALSFQGIGSSILGSKTVEPQTLDIAQLLLNPALGRLAGGGVEAMYRHILRRAGVWVGVPAALVSFSLAAWAYEQEEIELAWESKDCETVSEMQQFLNQYPENNPFASQAKSCIEWAAIKCIISEKDAVEAFLGEFPEHIKAQSCFDELEKQENSMETTLKSCHQLFADGDITTGPGGSSAFTCYDHVLETVPYHAEALAGLARIERHYVDQAVEALANGDLDSARDSIKNLEIVHSGSSDLKDLQGRLAAEEQSRAEAKVERDRLMAQFDTHLGEDRVLEASDVLTKLENLELVDEEKLASMRSELQEARAAKIETLVAECDRARTGTDLPVLQAVLGCYGEILLLDDEHETALEKINYFEYIIDYKETLTKDTVDGYFNFSQKYKDENKSLMSSVHDRLRKKEDEYWEWIDGSNDAEKFRLYIELFNPGKYRAEAEEQHVALDGE